MTEKKKEEKVVVPVPTQAEKIWAEIKDKPIDMFALPNQLVSKYCEPIKVEPTRLYLKFTASAVLPALDNAFGKKYSVEVIDRYIVMAPLPVFPKE